MICSSLTLIQVLHSGHLFSLGYDQSTSKHTAGGVWHEESEEQNCGIPLLSQQAKHFLWISFLLTMQFHDTFWCPPASRCSNQIGVLRISITYWPSIMQRLPNVSTRKQPPKTLSVVPVCFFQPDYSHIYFQ